MSDTLVSAQQLADHLHAWCVFDCRAQLNEPGWGARAFAAGHVPGARFLDLDTDLAAPPGAGGRHPLPDRAALTATLARLGAHNDQQLVFYDDTGGAFAARAWWLARWLGHPASAVLDGALAAWSGPLETVSGPPATGTFTARAPLTRQVDVEALSAGAGRFHLVDARARPRWAGLEEPIDPVAGHIPGAVCLPFQENLDDTGHFLPADRLRARFAGSGARTVCYCGSGVTAAHNVLAIRIAGLPEPMLYPGSWSEWIVDPERPVARTGPPA